MIPLFVYCNGPRRDLLFCRPLLRALLDHRGFALTIGACRGDDDLLFDLLGPHCALVESDLPNTRRGAILDLAVLCPTGAIPLPLVPGSVPEAPSYQWADALDGLCDALAARGLPCDLPADAERVPMLDFHAALPPPDPAQCAARPTIWLDLDHAGDDAYHFVYDLERLALALPECDFACTRRVEFPTRQFRDVSRAAAVERSKWSEACVALVGTTPWPFHLTLTERNRFKPKALCGVDARVHAPLWDYPGNPLELLAGMDDLVDFLIANVAQVPDR